MKTIYYFVLTCNYNNYIITEKLIIFYLFIFLIQQVLRFYNINIVRYLTNKNKNKKLEQCIKKFDISSFY